MRRFAAGACFAILGKWMILSAFADGFPPDEQYFVAMRIPQVDPVPRFVPISPSQTVDRATALSGCDGNTYYLTSPDAATVDVALSSGATVQIQVAEPGVAPEDTLVLCMVQASP